jgi:hypothetical protein
MRTLAGLSLIRVPVAVDVCAKARPARGMSKKASALRGVAALRVTDSFNQPLQRCSNSIAIINLLRV